MADAAKIETTGTDERLPLDEIWRRYPNEWVVLVDTDWDGGQETVGVVYAHSPSRKEAGTLACGLRDCTIYWTGKIQSPTLWFLTHARREV